jgi:MraZ protein
VVYGGEKWYLRPREEGVLVFSGWSSHSLDVKGRLAIPARFREVLKASGDERLVITSQDRSLVCYPKEQWSAITDKVGRLSQLDPNVQAFRRFFISGATECTYDGQGRVLIPQPLREWAGLNGQVLLVGMQNNFEVWDKDRWYQERERIQENFGDLSSFMADLGV